MSDTQATAQTQSALVHFTEESFAETLKNAGNKPVFVDFFAEWCGPCRLAAPIISELSDTYKDSAIIGKIDVDAASKEFSQGHSVMSIPTVIIFKNGKEVDRVIGFPGREKYVELIENAIKA